MDETPIDPQSMSNADLLKELAADTSLLLKRQIALAKLEAGQQLDREKHVLQGLGTAGALGFAGVIMLLVAASLALGEVTGHLWLGPLLFGGAVLLAAAITFGVTWGQRVRQPLPKTRARFDKEVSWLKHQLQS